jgi:predicted DNA-binding transcriptional regulator AlpA
MLQPEHLGGLELPSMPQKKPDPDDLLGASEASHILKTSTMTVRRLAKDGILPSIVILGVGSAFRRSDVEKLAAERRKGPKPAKGQE